MHQLLHLVFEVLAFIAGYAYYTRQRERLGDPIADEGRMWIIIGAAAGAFLGSRILGALERPDQLAWDLNAIFRAFNNRTIVGGLLGGLIGVELTKKWLGVRQRSGDLFVFPILLGLAIGRIGCALGGLEDNTYGIATDLPWGIDLGDGVRRHPTNLYEIAWLACIWIVLLLIERNWTLVPGARFSIFMVLYLEYRFIVEFIKPGVPLAFGITAIQWAAELGVLYYWKVWTRPGDLVQEGTGTDHLVNADQRTSA